MRKMRNRARENIRKKIHTRVIMSPTELKMQPTIHLEGKAFLIPSGSLSLVKYPV
jgi:hypothetical protein